MTSASPPGRSVGRTSSAVAGSAWTVCQDIVCPPGGTPLTTGECNCAFTCGASLGSFTCQSNLDCACVETTEGSGFCGSFIGDTCPTSGCSSSTECPSGSKC